MNPTVEKLLYVAAGAALYALAAWAPMATVRDLLVALAGGLPMSAMTRGVDARHEAKAAKRASSAPPPP